MTRKIIGHIGIYECNDDKGRYICAQLKDFSDRLGSVELAHQQYDFSEDLYNSFGKIVLGGLEKALPEVQFVHIHPGKHYSRSCKSVNDLDILKKIAGFVTVLSDCRIGARVDEKKIILRDYGIVRRGLYFPNRG